MASVFVFVFGVVVGLGLALFLFERGVKDGTIQFFHKGRWHGGKK